MQIKINFYNSNIHLKQQIYYDYRNKMKDLIIFIVYLIKYPIIK